MPKPPKTGFVAFPDGQHLVSDSVNGAAFYSATAQLKLIPWPTLKVIGLKLDNLIRDRIDRSDVFLADITFPNFNVYYEIGYAIARGKPFVPLVNTSVIDARDNVNRVGLFDTTGWLSYNNAEDIHGALVDWNPKAWTNKLTKQKDHTQPLFALDSRIKGDFRQYVFNSIQNSQVNFRTHDPAETPRLTIAQAISFISASTGVVLPLQNEIVDGGVNNNLRAAFLAGLSHGYGIDPLIIQYKNAPSPLDYRDYITNSASRLETDKHISEYCQQVLIRNQSSSRGHKPPISLLSQIDLGSASAESETQTLENYFVPTSAYARASRAERALVVGRKGSGKSAIHYRIASDLSRNPHTAVVEMRPSAHNLSELRESLLSVVEQGLFEHTIGAFWQYVIYLEILLKIREVALPKSKRDFDLQNRIIKIEEDFAVDAEMAAGDFAFRLESIVRQMLDLLSRKPTPAQVREQITNLLFERALPAMRERIAEFSDVVDGVTLLVDDLDKGWPARQLEKYDVSLIRHLIDAMNRAQRDLVKRRIDFRFVICIRSDVYENLIEQTPDRGKFNLIPVDWSDADQLRHMLRERVSSKFSSIEAVEAWDAFNPKFPDGTDGVGILIKNSLYRPRFLIEASERVISFAVNRGHSIVIEDDIENGLKQMSRYLVSEFGFEIRDVAGTPEKLFYKFIGLSDLLTYQEVEDAIKSEIDEDKIRETIELLMWYGFLGIAESEDATVFIFDRAYDFPRLLAELPQPASETLFAVNPAFLRGLTK